MGKVVFDISMSLDGFMTAANRRPEEPMGDGGQRLHEWAFGDDQRDREVLTSGVGTLGAVMGGAETGQQYLRAGLVDELSIHLVPVLFGSGTRMFDNLGDQHIQLEPADVIQTAAATHLRFRIAKEVESMQRNEPSSVQDLAVVARDIIDSNRYMTLATADGDGRPWAAPVWYAHEGYSDFLWVSRPEARHSRNLTSRPGLAIVIFDSTVPVGGAQAVYLEAVAEELSGAERERGIAIYSRRSEAHGAGHWRGADVVAPAAHRLYRARASQHFVLQANDQRILVHLSRGPGTGDLGTEA